MKTKMWCLINKKTRKIIKIHSRQSYVIGFETKKGLLNSIDESIEYDEEILKIEFEYK